MTLVEFRCSKCHKLLAKVGETSEVEAKCPRCGTMNERGVTGMTELQVLSKALTELANATENTVEFWIELKHGDDTYRKGMRVSNFDESARLAAIQHLVRHFVLICRTPKDGK